jgi:hypothetical protein
MRTLSKSEFVRKVLADKAKAKREEIKKAKKLENDLNSYSMTNHYRLLRKSGVWR